MARIITNDPLTRIAFSISESAQILGVSPGFIRLEIARGHVSPTRLGRRVLITREELKRYLTCGERGGQSDV